MYHITILYVCTYKYTILSGEYLLLLVGTKLYGSYSALHMLYSYIYIDSLALVYLY